MKKMKGVTVVFVIDRERCLRCGLCVDACPMSLFHQTEDGTVAIREGRCLSCFHCAAVCPAEAISHDQLGAAALPLPTDDSLLSKFQRRRAIRRFKPDTPDRAAIRAALDGAAYGPSAKNDRAYQWTVVLGKDTVDRLYQIYLNWARSIPELRVLVWLARRGVNPVTCGAPCLVLVHCPDGCANPHSDSVIAATLAEQLLADAGLGTCWGGYFQRAVDLCPDLAQALSIPEGHKVYAALMVGIPDEHYPRIPYRPEASIRWVE